MTEREEREEFEKAWSEEWAKMGPRTPKQHGFLMFQAGRRARQKQDVALMRSYGNDWSAEQIKKTP